MCEGICNEGEVKFDDLDFFYRYGHLTWEWKKGLRSYFHPLVFVFLYKLLHLCNLDTPWFMVSIRLFIAFRNN